MQLFVNDIDREGLARLTILATEAASGLCKAVALAVFHRGRLVLDAAWGHAGDGDAPLPPEGLLFDLASVSKLFTTTAFLSALHSAGLTVETPLVEVVPEFGAGGPQPIRGGVDPHTLAMLPPDAAARSQQVDPRQVTFRHVLTHTSGLAPWIDIFLRVGPPPPPPDQADSLSQAERLARGLAVVYQSPFAGQPGSGVRYSDLGLILLGEAAARLHGTPGRLEEAVRARALAPLGAPDILYNPVRDGGIPLRRTAPTEDDERWRQRRAWGEVHDENACSLGGVAGHAGLFGTARSAAAFGQAWLDDPVGRFGLSPQDAAAAVTEQAATGNERRGLGWMLKSREGSSAGESFSAESFGHTGFTGTSLWIDPQARLVVALLTNTVYSGRLKPGTQELRRAMHDALWQTCEEGC